MRQQGAVTYSVYSYSERPELETRGDDLGGQWPAFIFHDPLLPKYYPPLYARWGAFQLYWCDDLDTTAAACGSVPLAWDGTVDDLPEGWDGALVRGVEGAERGVPPTALCALHVTVSPRHVGRGVSAMVVEEMCALAREHGFDALMAPVRPTLKSRYPRMPIEQYVCWRRGDGLLFDPWMRTHERLGARILKVADRSMTIVGTVAEWEAWTGLEFPASGSYVVPGALVPVRIDREADRGEYVEPNVWMVHPLAR